MSPQDLRPANCRDRLRDEGKAYPRSGCSACSGTFGTGWGKYCGPAVSKTAPRLCSELEILQELPEKLKPLGAVEGVKALHAAYDALLFQAQEFIRRVDANDVSTNRTYAALKKLVL